MLFEETTYTIRGAIFEVYRELGPGLLESVYVNSLHYELASKGLKVVAQVGLPAVYKEIQLDLGFRVDLVVEDKILIEVKSVEALHDVYKKQLLTYLRLSKRRVGILVNFNVNRMQDKVSLIRIIN